MTAVRWRLGSPNTRQSIDRWIAGDDQNCTVIRSGPRRQQVRIETDDGPLLIKSFATLTGRHRMREQAKQWLHRSPAEREWKALVALASRGVRVPEPFAWGRLPTGDPILVMRFIPGTSLTKALRCSWSARKTLLASVGVEIRRFHESGYIHGDLHPENLIVSEEGPVIIDLQSACCSRSLHRRYADLGALDYGLWKHLSRPDRLRLRAAALDLRRPFQTEDRDILHAVGVAAERRAFQHAASRTRRAGFPGRQFAPITLAGYSGLRLRELSPEAIETAVSQHNKSLLTNSSGVIKAEGRSRITRSDAQGNAMVVKQILVDRKIRILADAFRGSAGRRAWLAGHGLSARGIGVARPLAFLEKRLFGLLPIASYIILEDLKSESDTLAASQQNPEAAAETLIRLLISLHLRSIDHPDMKATNILLCISDDLPNAKLLDIEGVHFRKHLSDQKRIEALAQLNASLPDSVSAEIRRCAFLNYAAILPFATGNARALADVVRKSITKRHRWTGDDCALAQRHDRT